MKRLLIKTYHFLGSVSLAIILITLTALFVIGGTFMESHTGSHEYAERNIYGTFLFSLLLWGFFINILVAALRRWPFRKKHIPFLITHCGLLMILGGVLIKHYAGVQGSIFLMEGSSTNQMMIPDSQALRIDAAENESPLYVKVPFQSSVKLQGLEIQLLHLTPHCCERLETFIKGNWIVLNGMPPFPLETGFNAVIGDREWMLLGKKNADVASEIRHHYIENTRLTINDRAAQKAIFDIPLKTALQAPFSLRGQTTTVQLNMQYTPIHGIEDAYLKLVVNGAELTVKLQGEEAFQNLASEPYSTVGSYDIDLHAQPSVLFLQDDHNDLSLVAFGPHGDIHAKAFRQDNLSSLYSYDNGYGGYSMQTKVHYLKDSRQNLEEGRIQSLKKQLSESTFEIHQLSPPLQLLWKACQANDHSFPESCIDYMVLWSRQGGWLFLPEQLPDELQKVFAKLDWTLLADQEWKGTAWSAVILKNIEEQIHQGDDLIDLLNRHDWPFLDEILTHPRSNDKGFVLDSLTSRLFDAGNELPPIPLPKVGDAAQNALIFSAYCRAYGIHLSQIFQGPWDRQCLSELILECPLTTRQKQLPPTTKLEENTPLITFGLREGTKGEQMTLSYDRQAQGLKWPNSRGSHQFRFQPLFVTLPYEVRLRRARQISYPGTNQPYSYESDLIVTDTRSGKSVESTISMNNVHETWDGYRFYLSTMSPNDESAAKRIQLAVNLDPAKYFLTYPGAIILSLGIILLFWLRPYRT